MADESEKVESPVIEAPVIEAPKVPEIDKEALVSELTKLGVKNPDDLVNMQRASREAGNLANILGQVRNENQELKRMIQSLQQSSQAGYQSSDQPAVDLRQVVRSEVEGVVKGLTQQQIQAQEALENELADIETDKDFMAVSDVWQKYLNNRNTQSRLRRGETSLTREYYRLVGTYKDKMIEAHTNALKLSSTKQKAAPHVERGDTHSPQVPATDDERKQKLKRISEDRSKGNLESNRALEQMVEQMFPPEVFKL
jgi:hypothetical protein